MQGDLIALTIAKEAVGTGLDKLSPKTKTIVFNSIQMVFGFAVGVMAAVKLYDVLFNETEAAS